jgi:peroxin-12
MSTSNIHSTVNFTSSSPIVSSKLPSVFELLAQERLNDLIRPCLRQILKFLNSIRPLSPTFALLYTYKDEFIVLIESIVQYIYLHTYAALVSERFYGLQRTASHRVRSLILSVFLPYVKIKLDSLYEQMSANTSNRSRTFYVMLKILPKIQVG